MSLTTTSGWPGSSPQECLPLDQVLLRCRLEQHDLLRRATLGVPDRRQHVEAPARVRSRHDLERHRVQRHDRRPLLGATAGRDDVGEAVDPVGRELPLGE
jgi:hypothetical protein